MFLFMKGYPCLPVSAMGPIPPTPLKYYLNKLSQVTPRFRVVGEDVASVPSWQYMVGIWSTPLSTGADLSSVENNKGGDYG